MDEQKQKFQQLLDGVSDSFFEWAANRIHTEAQVRFVLLPCHPEHPAQKYIAPTEPKKAAKKNKSKLNPVK